MTTDQILVQCDTIRGLSEKATPGPWIYDKGEGLRFPGISDLEQARKYDEDARFCESVRTFAPSAAQALKVAIEALTEIANETKSDHDAQEDGPTIEAITAQEALQQITEAFK